MPNGIASELETLRLKLPPIASGLAHHRLGDAARAEESFEEARVAFAEVGFRAHVAHALQGLAACAASMDRYDDAAGLLGQAAAELGEIVYSEEDFPLLASPGRRRGTACTR